MIHDDSPDMLPGFDPAATKASDSGLRAAAAATLDALRGEGLLSPKHALTAQLLIATAERAGAGLQSAKTSIATTNLIRLLLEVLDKLPVNDESVSDAAQQFLAALEAAEQAAQ